MIDKSQPYMRFNLRPIPRYSKDRFVTNRKQHIERVSRSQAPDVAGEPLRIVSAAGNPMPLSEVPGIESRRNTAVADRFDIMTRRTKRTNDCQRCRGPRVCNQYPQTRRRATTVATLHDRSPEAGAHHFAHANP